MISYYINTTLGAELCFAFILLDYLRKYKTDYFQRKLFVMLLFLSMLASLFDFCARLLLGFQSGAAAAIYFFVAVSLVAQNATLYVIVIFLHYVIKKSTRETKKAITIAAIAVGVYAVSVLANALFHFYFDIKNGIIVHAKFSIISRAAMYFPMLLSLVYLLINLKLVKSAYNYLLVVFILIAAAGKALDDFVLKGGNLLWPCLAALFLYIYFFIIQNDAKIDALTGINNRYAFNELINRIARQLTVKSYAVALLDVDRFKKINDTFGHAEGDNALCDIARIIMSSIRHTDFAARYGGDEFIIVTDSMQTVRIILDRIESGIKEQNLSGLRRYDMEISYGYGLYVSNSNQDIEAFLESIDRLMYSHKNSKPGRKTI